MSTLLIDIGNSRVKWARAINGRLSRQHAAPHAGWDVADFQRVLCGGARPERMLVVSVAGPTVEARLARAARAAFGIKPAFVRSSRRLGGVTTRYKEPWRLGADRLVAVIGGHHLVPSRAVCVVDIGTAMTLDLLDARGVHRGGAIVPGPRLMVDSLLEDTSGIRRRAGGRAPGRSLFARDTRAALEQGARYACAALIDRAVGQARDELGDTPVVLLTGGAVTQVQSLIHTRHRSVPDLVLRGLLAML